MWAWVIGPLGPGHAWSPARFCSFLLVSSSVALSPSFAGEGDGFPRLVLPGGARRRKVRAAVPRFCSQSPTASSWSGSAGAAPPPQRRSCQVGIPRPELAALSGVVLMPFCWFSGLRRRWAARFLSCRCTARWRPPALRRTCRSTLELVARFLRVFSSPCKSFYSYMHHKHSSLFVSI